MIQLIRISNFGPFTGGEWHFTAHKSFKKDQSWVADTPNSPTLRACGIFGGNCSGKTAFIEAVSFIASCAKQQPIEPFNRVNKEDNSWIEVFYVLDSDCYMFCVEVGPNDRIVEERLFLYDGNKFVDQNYDRTSTGLVYSNLRRFFEEKVFISTESEQALPSCEPSENVRNLMLACDLTPNHNGKWSAKYLRVFNAVEAALREGKTLVIDDFGLGLHPNLTLRLMNMFSHLHNNQNNAQLIFTSHESTLISHMRRDQVIFTERNYYGVCNVEQLLTYKHRFKDHRTAYLRGRYGGIPFFSDPIS